MIYLIGIALIVFGINGIMICLDKYKNVTTLKNTPWNESDSWLCYIALMMALISMLMQELGV